MKKILIVSASFEPDKSPRSYRATELAKELSRQGHHVTVVTPTNDAHNKLTEDFGIVFENLQRSKKVKESKGALVKPTFYSRLSRRILKVLFEYPDILLMRAVSKSIGKLGEFDVLISIAVPFPIHWGVAYCWSLENNTHNVARVWVADCGDPYMFASHDTFPKMPYFQLLENWFLKKADIVTVPFENMKDFFNPKYRNKYRVLPQGFKIGEIKLANYKKNLVPTIGFSGTIMPGFRDPFSLIDFLLSENIEFKFIIYTKQHHLFKRYANFVGEIIELREYVPRHKLIYELSKMDFLVNINTDTNNGFVNAIPTKLIDYILSERPILSYEHSKLPRSKVRQFLQHNFSGAYEDVDFERYRIESVVEKLLEYVESVNLYK